GSGRRGRRVAAVVRRARTVGRHGARGGGRGGGCLAEHGGFGTGVRGSISSVAATRPDGHTEPGFNLPLAAAVRAALPSRVAVIAQGSIVDADLAERAVAGGACDAVEMTRAQIAEPALAALVAAGRTGEIRPCILCNQACQVRDARNPIVSCVV